MQIDSEQLCLNKVEGTHPPTHQLTEARLRADILPCVDGAVDDSCLVFLLEKAGDDRLAHDTIASVVHHYCAQSIQVLHLHLLIGGHTLQVHRL